MSTTPIVYNFSPSKLILTNYYGLFTSTERKLFAMFLKKEIKPNYSDFILKLLSNEENHWTYEIVLTSITNITPVHNDVFTISPSRFEFYIPGLYMQHILSMSETRVSAIRFVRECGTNVDLKSAKILIEYIFNHNYQDREIDITKSYYFCF